LLWGGTQPGEGSSNTGTPNSPSSENTNGVGGDVNGPTYEYTDVSYDYASAFEQITKNDGAGLVGSANGSAGSSAKSMIEAIAAVKDSVVEITTTVESNRGTMTAGAGSGVIIHADGIVVTNNHVVADSDNIYVRLSNGDTYEAALRGTDEDGDIAILKITPQEGKPLTVAKLGSSSALALGEEVFAIGNPLGELGGTVTNGIISATARAVNVDGTEMTLLQTNAAINSGNSGGGLFNLAGELIGVVNAKYSATGVEGLGFAIPIDSAYENSIKDLMEVGYIRGLPALGITLVEKTSAWGSVVYAAYVYDANGVPGFQDGDYIYSIDDTVVYSINTSALSAIKSIVRSHEIGDTLSVIVLRTNGTRQEQVSISVTLQEYIPQGIGE
jgi:serine protease Do